MNAQMEKRCCFPVIEETFGTLEPTIEDIKKKIDESSIIERCEILPVEDGTDRIKIEIEIKKTEKTEKRHHLKNEFVKGPDQEDILYLQAYMWAEKKKVWNGFEWKGGKE